MNLLVFLDRRRRDWPGRDRDGGGLLSGAASAALIALVNTALVRGTSASGLLAAAFAGLLVAKMVTNAVARVLLAHLAQRTLSYLCSDLSRKILATPLRQLERSASRAS